MSEILLNAKVDRLEAQLRAVAHERSAEWHRKMGVRLGIATTIVSAIVGSAVFVTVTTQLGISGKGTLSIPQDFLARGLFYIVLGLSILSPILAGLQTYLNEPGQAAKHTSSAAEYSHVKQRFDDFIGRYEAPNLDGKEREEAIKEKAAISDTMEKVKKDAIPLTEDLQAEIRKQLAERKP